MTSFYLTRLILPKVHEMPRFAAKRGFIHKASEQGDGRTSLIFTCLKAMNLSIKGVKNKETRWYELKGAK